MTNAQEGRWIKRKTDEHKCQTPALDHNSGVREGDEWRCHSCYGVWLVKYEQRGGYYWHAGAPIRYDTKPSFSRTGLGDH